MTLGPLPRRQFLGAAATSAFSFMYVPQRVWGANERINVAGIGVGGKGAGEVRDVTAAGGRFVALCDVDASRASKTFKAHPDAKVYQDFRRMLEKEKGIDAVTVSTPDHTHAVASLAAMSLGKHVYCQKPLTHTILEARLMQKAADHFGVQTQMGNQAHAGEPIRRAVELIRAGIIGSVSEVHCWTNRPIWPQGQSALDERTKLASQKKPADIDWDLWLGPAAERDYNACYAPFKWRGWWDFGTGALGDMACHIMDMPYWALDLGSPATVSAESGGQTSETGPDWATITYQFPSRKQVGGGETGASTGPASNVDQPAVKFVWYDGVRDGRPNAPHDLLKQATAEVRSSGTLPEVDKSNRKLRKAPKAIDAPGRWDLVMVGDKGMMLFNRSSTTWIVSPSARVEEFVSTPRSVPRVENEDAEWLAAISGGSKPLSSFDYAGPFTEVVLLGNLAVRLEDEIHWDAANLAVRNLPEAEPLIRGSYRKGWELPASTSLLSQI